MSDSGLPTASDRSISASANVIDLTQSDESGESEDDCNLQPISSCAYVLQQNHRAPKRCADETFDVHREPKVITPRSGKKTRNLKIDVVDEDAKQIPSLDSDDGHLFSSDDEIVPRNIKGSPDENDRAIKNGSNSKHTGDSNETKDDNDDESLFSRTDDEIDERVANESDSDRLFSSDEEQNYKDAVGLHSDDEISVSSRFSEGNDESFSKHFNIFEATAKLKKEKSKYLMSMKDYKTPTTLRHPKECYYLSLQFKDRILVDETLLSTEPPVQMFTKFGKTYELVYSDLVQRDAKRKSFYEDKMGLSYIKSYYYAVEGPGLETTKLDTILSSIGDFESISYEDGVHKALSRIKLLCSPAGLVPGSDDFSMFDRLTEEDFEMIEDNGHLGCGFIPRYLLIALLGKSIPAQRVFAVQVRIVGPSCIGIAKGMLFAKDGIDKIQVPSSMVKVGKSKCMYPLHRTVVLNITQNFPTKSQRYIGRLYNASERQPTERQLAELKPISRDVRRVLKCKGVQDKILDKYHEDFLNNNRFNHASLIGVIDPTGHIPVGHVFLTGIKGLNRVFLTVNPCTEGKDGILCEVVQNLPKEAKHFFNTIAFGAVVFAQGEDSLPPKMNDGDLDGDLYVAIWDDNILNAIKNNDCVEPGNVDDDLVGTFFKYELNGKLYNSEVVKKLNADNYMVHTGKGMKTAITLKASQICDDSYFISEVINHKINKNDVEFCCKWNEGEQVWLSTSKIKEYYVGGPTALWDYAREHKLLTSSILTKKFVEWLRKDQDDAILDEIIDHRASSTNGKIEVQCRYDDGDEIWLPLNEAIKDSKIFLGAYAYKKRLLGEPIWKQMKRFWLDEAQDLMCKHQRKKKLKSLVSYLHDMYDKSFNDQSMGCNHDASIIYGRAWKKSLEIEKHGNVIVLPYYYYRRVPSELKAFALPE